MSVAGFDFELNGVKYNAAEDAEGDHYVNQGEPLRPPNAVTIQGESRQKFQMRPDAIKWSLTDWSGGEGQIKYDPQAPNRWRELTGVRAFERPGTLQPGYYIEDTQDSTGSSDLAVEGSPGVGGSTLYLLDHAGATDNIYAWDDTNKRWGAVTNLATGGAGGTGFLVGDGTHVYWMESGAGVAWKYDGSTLTQLGSTFTGSAVIYAHPLGGASFIYRGLSGVVWELRKNGDDSASTGTTLDDFSNDPATSDERHVMCVLDGKLYVLANYHNSTAVREIVPSTAAGTGFGAEISRIQGFEGQAIWSHSGRILLLGSDGVSEDTAVMYLTPGGEYGSLGEVRPGVDLGTVVSHSQAGRMLDTFFVAENGNGSGVHGLWQIDAISGGMAMIGYVEDADIDGTPLGPVAYNGDLFWGVQDAATTARVARARTDQYTKSSEAISAWHDYDLADEKLLSSLVLSVEDLPADWQVRVDYALDGEDTWTNAIDYSTTNGNGTKQAVSTDTTTVKFRTLSIRVRMDYTGAGIPTSGPVILGVDANAMVAKTITAFRLLLDLSDDRDRVGGSSGSRKQKNLKAAADTEGVVAFKDGYESFTPGEYTEYDMVIDSYNIVLSTPGEGVAMVTLREPI